MKTPDARDLLATWPDRERFWRRKLGRIHLGVEPIPDQIERYRKMTWAMTAVAAGIQAMFIALFSAFAHPFIGMAVAAVILGPVILFSWIGFWRMQRRAARYLEEKAEIDRLRGRPDLPAQG